MTTSPTRGTRSLGRATVQVSALTALSRVTGFARVVVVAAVLGTTPLGDTYQTANAVPNIVFELVAAGVVQAVLIPSLVVHLDRRDKGQAEHVAGAVLGLSGAVLGAITLVGVVAAPWLARALFAGADPALRDDQVRLATVFLWIFLPQVLLYAAGIVATSVLNAQERFIAPALAPVASSVVVIASYLAFGWMRGDAGGGLDISGLEVAVLAGGTTMGVVALSALPLVGAWRTGFRLVPNLDHRHPEVRSLLGRAGWAAAFLASTQVLTVTVLVLGNRVAGTVVAYNVAFTFFLLPHALFALPVITTLFPTLSRLLSEGRTSEFGDAVGRGIATMGSFVLPAAAALTALAPWLMRGLLFGQTDAAGQEQVARLLMSLAPGAAAYGAFLFLARAFYAAGDTRTPAVVNLRVVLVGAVIMVVGFATVEGPWQVAMLGMGHSVAYLGGTVVLARSLWRKQGLAGGASPWRKLGPSLLGAVVAWAAMAAIVATVDPSGRVQALTGVAVVGLVGAATYLAVTLVAGGPKPRELLVLHPAPDHATVLGSVEATDLEEGPS